MPLVFCGTMTCLSFDIPVPVTLWKRQFVVLAGMKPKGYPWWASSVYHVGNDLCDSLVNLDIARWTSCSCSTGPQDDNDVGYVRTSFHDIFGNPENIRSVAMDFQPSLKRWTSCGCR